VLGLMRWRYGVCRVGSILVTRVVEPAPLGGSIGDKGSEKREMAAGKGTGKAGRPPVTGILFTAISTTLSTKINTSYLVHKH
jgi:hypothetical protein